MTYLSKYLRGISWSLLTIHKARVLIKSFNACLSSACYLRRSCYEQNKSSLCKLINTTLVVSFEQPSYVKFKCYNSCSLRSLILISLYFHTVSMSSYCYQVYGVRGFTINI